MKLLALNDEEHSLLQNILNNFVLHGIESVPDDGSCNVLKMNDKINELKDIEPVCFGIINEEDGKLFWDRAKNRKERAIYHRDILSKYSLGKKLTVSPLYRLD